MEHAGLRGFLSIQRRQQHVVDPVAIEIPDQWLEGQPRQAQPVGGVVQQGKPVIAVQPARPELATEALATPEIHALADEEVVMAVGIEIAQRGDERRGGGHKALGRRLHVETVHAIQ